MSQNNNEQKNGKSNNFSLEKRADILQASFEHYYKMAMDHHTKAATTSNLLLIIVGALIALVAHDNKFTGDVDVFGGIGVFIVGLFGAVWVLKQHERYFYWQLIANKYQEELANIVPKFKTRDEYHKEFALETTKEKFGPIHAKEVDRYLWISLHSIVAVIGICIAIYAMCGS